MLLIKETDVAAILVLGSCCYPPLNLDCDYCVSLSGIALMGEVVPDGPTWREHINGAARAS